MLPRVATWLAAAAMLSACGGEPPDDAVATFDGGEVTASEYQASRRFEVLQATQAAIGKPVLKARALPALTFEGAPDACARTLRTVATDTVRAMDDPRLRDYCRRLAAQVDKQAIQGVLADRVSTEEARRLGIEASSTEVDAELQRLYASLGGEPGPAAEERLRSAAGITPEQLHGRAQIAALEAKIRDRVVAQDGQVTDGDLRAFYRANRHDFDTPEKRDLDLLETTSRSKATAALAEIDAGASFASVARRVSDRPKTRRAGGHLGLVAEDDLDASLARVVFGASSGALVGPVRSRGRYYVARIRRVAPAGAPSFEKLEPILRQMVEPTKPAQAWDRWQRNAVARWKPKVVCREGYTAAPLCSNYVDQPIERAVPPVGAPATSSAAK